MESKVQTLIISITLSVLYISKGLMSLALIPMTIIGDLGNRLLKTKDRKLLLGYLVLVS